MTNHNTYMSRCLEIAKLGLGTTRPNPMVGAVIVVDGKIISEGYTSPYGGPHAEVNAFNNVPNKSILEKATLYATLEPCSHFGKTPPCSDLIIQHRIPRVVIGCVDDNPKVAGKGIAKLKDAGIDVTVGVLEQECKVHHKRFFTFHNKKRPYIILKWAQSQDGYIAPKTKDHNRPVWLTSKVSRQLVHKWRTEEQAILVGTNTIIEDNPMLTARDWKGNNPIRVVLDPNNRLDKSYAVFNNEAQTIHLDSNALDWKKPNIAEQICNTLHKNDINSMIIEGGAKTLQTFIDEELWDEARVFTSKMILNDGTQAPKLNGQLTESTTVATDTLNYYAPN
ncbi:bifunctional diaminohydroxyphosphoribosylaminopyrimidine deaminase/5-amino-6-(5-phosphoribosylamino)uracil reductase RibD [Winogradskyella maritima]|uniref:Riboflavin biosynthesis protein RibD n=1 Tax=Winogradskyella maritima TaxID=1517766 RepID=A0ABV8ACE9_9FLAO|nr:bifunctional diaminohydroxyphosphoribosylaminopyrimidine deaminase/5-amino-6-(5-phosphoribosylamino)uracil reductase RibD [Winogradskyella maritima]